MIFRLETIHSICLMLNVYVIGKLLYFNTYLFCHRFFIRLIVCLRPMRTHIINFYAKSLIQKYNVSTYDYYFIIVIIIKQVLDCSVFGIYVCFLHLSNFTSSSSSFSFDFSFLLNHHRSVHFYWESVVVSLHLFFLQQISLNSALMKLHTTTTSKEKKQCLESNAVFSFQF